MIYLDSSALVKLILAEAESTALEDHLSGVGDRASSALAGVEIVRAARRRSVETVVRARVLLRWIDLIAVDAPLLEVAADLEDDRLRSLDAIHVAAALSLGEDLTELVTYDQRMIGAARDLALPVSSPA